MAGAGACCQRIASKLFHLSKAYARYRRSGKRRCRSNGIVMMILEKEPVEALYLLWRLCRTSTTAGSEVSLASSKIIR